MAPLWSKAPSLVCDLIQCWLKLSLIHWQIPLQSSKSKFSKYFLWVTIYRIVLETGEGVNIKINKTHFLVSKNIPFCERDRPTFRFVKETGL